MQISLKSSITISIRENEIIIIVYYYNIQIQHTQLKICYAKYTIECMHTSTHTLAFNSPLSHTTSESITFHFHLPSNGLLFHKIYN